MVETRNNTERHDEWQVVRHKWNKKRISSNTTPIIHESFTPKRPSKPQTKTVNLPHGKTLSLENCKQSERPITTSNKSQNHQDITNEVSTFSGKTPTNRKNSPIIPSSENSREGMRNRRSQRIFEQQLRSTTSKIHQSQPDTAQEIQPVSCRSASSPCLFSLDGTNQHTSKANSFLEESRDPKHPT